MTQLKRGPTKNFLFQEKKIRWRNLNVPERLKVFERLYSRIARQRVLCFFLHLQHQFTLSWAIFVANIVYCTRAVSSMRKVSRSICAYRIRYILRHTIGAHDWRSAKGHPWTFTFLRDAIAIHRGIPLSHFSSASHRWSPLLSDIPKRIICNLSSLFFAVRDDGSETMRNILRRSLRRLTKRISVFASQEGELLEKNTDWIYEWSSRPDQAPPKYEILDLTVNLEIFMWK